MVWDSMKPCTRSPRASFEALTLLYQRARGTPTTGISPNLALRESPVYPGKPVLHEQLASWAKDSVQDFVARRGLDPFTRRRVSKLDGLTSTRADRQERDRDPGELLDAANVSSGLHREV